MLSTPILPSIPTYINVLSPYHINISSTGTTWTHAQLSLWVWEGEFDDADVVNGLPNKIFYKEKVSITDDIIVFELSDYIKQYLDPTIDFQGTSATTVSSMSVWVYYDVFIFNNPLNLLEPTAIETQSSDLSLAINSYNWNYENQIGLDYSNKAFGTTSVTPTEEQNKYVEGTGQDFYFTNTFNQSTTGLTSTFDQVNLDFLGSPVTHCSLDPYIILYLNKNGGWDTFNTHGKVVIEDEIKSKEYEHSFRNPLFFDNSQHHSIKKYNFESTQKYTINTGAINAIMGNKVEEIQYSSSIFLIKFNEDFSSYRQIPVVVDGPRFQRKTAINDKNKISYVMTFKETTNKLRNVR